MDGVSSSDEADSDTTNCPWIDDYLNGGISIDGVWTQTAERDVSEYKDLTVMDKLKVGGMFTFIDTRTSG